MPHEWILQVLADLEDYALANDLPAIAEAAGEALIVARAELDASDCSFEGAVMPPEEGLH